MSWFRKQAPDSADRVEDAAVQDGKHFAGVVKQEGEKTINAAKHDLQNLGQSAQQTVEQKENDAKGWFSSAKNQAEQYKHSVEDKTEDYIQRGKQQAGKLQNDAKQAESGIRSWFGSKKQDVDNTVNNANQQLQQRTQQFQNDVNNTADNLSRDGRRTIDAVAQIGQSAYSDAQNKANDLKQRTDAQVNDAKSQASGWFNRAKNEVDKDIDYAKSEAHQFVHDAEAKLHDAENKASGWFQRSKNDASRTVDNVKNDAQQHYNDAKNSAESTYNQYTKPTWSQRIDRTAERYDIDPRTSSSDNIMSNVHSSHTHIDTDKYKVDTSDLQRTADNVKDDVNQAKSGFFGWFSSKKSDADRAAENAKQQAQQYGSRLENDVRSAEQKASDWFNSAKNDVEQRANNASTRPSLSQRIDRTAERYDIDPRTSSSDNIMSNVHSSHTHIDDLQRTADNAKDKADQAKSGFSSWFSSKQSDADRAAEQAKQQAQQYGSKLEDKVKTAEQKASEWFNSTKSELENKAKQTEQEAKSWFDSKKHDVRSGSEQHEPGLLDRAADKINYVKERAHEEAAYNANKIANEAQYAYRKAQTERKYAQEQTRYDAEQSQAADIGRDTARRVEGIFDDTSKTAAQKGRSLWSIITGKTDDASRQVKQASNNVSDSISETANNLQATIEKELNQAAESINETADWIKAKLIGTARNDTYRTPQHDIIGTQYDNLFRFYPVSTHNLVINTPDILPPTSTVRINHWKFNPSLSWQIIAREPTNAVQAVTTRFNTRAVETTNAGQIKHDAYLTSALYIPTTNYTTASYLNVSGNIDNRINGSAIGFKSYIDLNKAIATTRARIGSIGPALSITADINTDTLEYQLATGLSQTLYRHQPSRTDISLGINTITTPMTDLLKTKNNQYNVENLITRADATIQYNQGNKYIADAKLSITPSNHTATVGDFRVRAAYSNSLYSTKTYPFYSIGVALGAVSFSDNVIYDSDANGYRSAAKQFQQSTSTKQLGIVDLLYQINPTTRFSARVSSDRGAALNYYQQFAEGVTIRTSIHNGQTGIFGNANNQRSIEPVLGVGITIGD